MHYVEKACMDLDLRIVADPKQIGRYKILNDGGKCVYQYWASKDLMMRTGDYKKFYFAEIVPELERYKDERFMSNEPPTMSCRLSANNAEGIGVPVGGLSDSRGRSVVRARFEDDVKRTRDYNRCTLIAVVQLPTGAKEIITNTSCIQDKIHYYLDKYDDQFRLKTCPDVRILGILLV